MQQTIPIQPVAAQTFQATLGAQDCQITLRQFGNGLYIDVLNNTTNTPIVSGRYCVDRVSIIRPAYLGFVGWLYFVDVTQAGQDPDYTGLGSRYQLVYES